MKLLFVALMALVAGMVNAVAGGGTFIVFPTLTGVSGLTEKAANIACTIGLWPGSASSVIAARKQAMSLSPRILSLYAVLCLAGGTLGAILLQKTSDHSFDLLIPWLLAFATLVFALGKRVAAWVRRTEAHPSTSWIAFSACVQFIIAIYGGYFGAGIGVLTLAGLSVTGLGDLHQLNALKVVLSTCTNLAAAVIFLFGPVPWHEVGVLAAASTVGGFSGMVVAQRMSQTLLRGIILTVGIGLTGFYFWKSYIA